MLNNHSTDSDFYSFILKVTPECLRSYSGGMLSAAQLPTASCLFRTEIKEGDTLKAPDGQEHQQNNQLA